MNKHRKKNILRDLARYFGIKVKYVDYLGNDVHGKLLPREKRILINAHKPRNEHVYTLLHEIGHFLLHFKSPPKKHHPKFCDVKWEAGLLASLCSKIRRYSRFVFTSDAGKEWEADAWAMCAFVYLARYCGFREELMTFLDRHPDKNSIFLLTTYSFVYNGVKKRIKKVAHAVAMPLQAIWKFAMA